MPRDEGAGTASLAHEQRPEAVTMFRPGWRASAALVHGAFRTLVFGQALGQLGDGLTQIAFAQLVVFDIGRGASPGRIAGILAVTLLPFSLLGPLGGVLIDRWDRRRTLIIASLCRASLAAVAIAAARAAASASSFSATGSRGASSFGGGGGAGAGASGLSSTGAFFTARSRYRAR